MSISFFGDVNPFKNSAAGVRFFTVTDPDLYGYEIFSIQGFVQELAVVHDPEYQWMDSFRTPRVSNEERRLLFYHLARQVKKAVSTRAAELEANSVIGYRQEFDVEDESRCIIARGYGTACTILPMFEELEPDNAVFDLPSVYQKSSFSSLFPNEDARLSFKSVTGSLPLPVGPSSMFERAPTSERQTVVGYHPKILEDVALLSITSLPESYDNRYRIGGIVSVGLWFCLLSDTLFRQSQ